MEKYIHRENLALFKRRLAESHNDAEREVRLLTSGRGSFASSSASNFKSRSVGNAYRSCWPQHAVRAPHMGQVEPNS